MNKHKITSILLISTMLSESLSVVNAYDNIPLDNTTVASENNDTQYIKDIKEDSNVDVFDDNNTIDNNDNEITDDIESCEIIEDVKDSDLEDLDVNSNLESDDNIDSPDVDDNVLENDFIINDSDLNASANNNQDIE